MTIEAATITRAVGDALAILEQGRPEWIKRGTDWVSHELELAAIMPGNGRADNVRAAALALFLAEGFDHD